MIIEDIILKEVQKNPDKIFCNIENRPISFKIFNKNIVLIQKTIQEIGKNVKRIGLNFNKTILLLSSIIACNREGKTPIILPDKKFQLKNFNYNEAANIECELNENSCIMQHNEIEVLKSYKYDENATQCVVFSSGTEGFPKPVELSFSNIYYSVDSWNAVVEFIDDGIYLNVLPLHHISGLSIFFRSIYCGFSVYYDKYSSKNIIKIINSIQPDYISFVPKMVKDIMEIHKSFESLKNIKLLIIGGDSINKNIFDYLSKFEINSYVSYGMTETASGVAGYFIKNKNSFIVNYLGIPHKNVNIVIKHNQIVIESKMVFKKYVGEANNKNIFSTNDLGEIKNNELFFKSRKNQMIVSGGENINLLTIQNALFPLLVFL